MPGSEAYERAQGDQDRAKTFAYQQAQDSAIGQGQTAQAQDIANQTAVRTAPINELSAIRSNSQVQMPSFQPTAQSSAAGTNISGLIEQNYQQQVANSNNAMNGLFSLGGAALSGAGAAGGFGALFGSDRRLKRDIVHVGESPEMHMPVYDFSYIGSSERHRGYMADDVQDVLPEAVVTMPNGFKAVYYDMVR